MHPALSVIVFTVSSGAGYGLLFLVALLAATGVLPTELWLGATLMTSALGLVSLGLISSTLHLGRPERAWRAFSQWRSSWLSREGVFAVLTYPVALAFAGGWLFTPDAGWWRALALLAAALAAVTVVCTAMIYASLKPVHQWRNAWVLPCYLALALASGALWLDAIRLLFAEPIQHLNGFASVCVVIGLGCKLGYWRFIDTTKSASTAESATGLGHIGKVRLLDPPHLEDNYLLKEMGYRIARKHRIKLRRVALGLGFALPLALMVVTHFLTAPWSAVPAVLAAASAMLGLLAERWLFFAEAKHTVILYYGADQA
jgi:DMSO reductase anchor subunit